VRGQRPPGIHTVQQNCGCMQEKPKQEITRGDKNRRLPLIGVMASRLAIRKQRVRIVTAEALCDESNKGTLASSCFLGASKTTPICC